MKVYPASRVSFDLPRQIGKRKETHSRPQRPRSFWSAPRITTSGLVQRHSVFEWLCKHNRLRPQPIIFVKLDSEHAQKSRTSGVGLGQRSRFLVLTKRSAASGDENEGDSASGFEISY